MTLSGVRDGTLVVNDDVYRRNFQPKRGQTAWRMLVGGGETSPRRAGNCWGKVTSFFNRVGGFDKGLKVAGASCQMAMAVDPNCGSGVRQADKQIKIVRDYLAVGKCVVGAWNLTGSVRNVVTIGQSLRNGNRAQLNRGGPFAPERPSYSETLVTDREKYLGLASQGLAIVVNTAFTLGFALKNINFANKFDSGMSDRAKHVGSQMPLVMFINHIAGIFKDVVDWFLEKVTYQRAVVDLPWLEHSGPDQEQRVRERQAIDRMHTDSKVRIALTTVKHAFELAHDASLFTPMHPAAKAAVSLVSGVFDFATMWVATA